MNCDEMAGERLTVCEQELLYAFAHPVSISSYLLFIVVQEVQLYTSDTLLVVCCSLTLTI